MAGIYDTDDLMRRRTGCLVVEIAKITSALSTSSYGFVSWSHNERFSGNRMRGEAYATLKQLQDELDARIPPRG